MLTPFTNSATLFALLHCGVALACVAVARRRRRDAPLSSEVSQWWWYSGVLALLGLNTLWRFEDPLVSALRGVAQQAQWYAERGTLQLSAVVALLGLVATVWALQGFAQSRTARRKAGDSHHLVRAGLAMLFIHLVLRTVSWHVTDQLIFTRVAWISLGRWLDIVGLGLAAWGAWRRWRMR